MLKEEKLVTYLKFIGKINKHNSARLLLATSSVQADSRDHVHAAALNEIVIGSKFEDLDTTIDSRLGNSKLACQCLHNTSPCELLVRCKFKGMGFAYPL